MRWGGGGGRRNADFDRDASCLCGGDGRGNALEEVSPFSV